MATFQKIQDAYFIYSCLDKNIILLKQFSNVSAPTLKKYITIYENLDVRLFPYLDNKKKKLSIDLALDLCKKTLNHDTQYKMFIDLFKKTVKENKIILRENSCCLICCEDSNYIRTMDCCGNLICEKCFFKTVLMSLNDFTFKFIKCPMCNQTHSILDIKNYHEYIRSKNEYMNKWKFKSYIGYDNTFYNGIQRYIQLHKKIVEEKTLVDSKTKFKRIKVLEKSMDKEIYGLCVQCSPSIEHRRNPDYKNLKIKCIERRCVDSENQIVVLKKEMFHCSECSKVNNEVKKCPHCGVKTVKPDQCNFIPKCECKQAWCFICGSRLPNDAYGHNHHYWTGNGTSAFSPDCRVTLKTDTPDHVIKRCHCKHCRKRNYKPLCLHLECNNTAIDYKKKYCKEHYTK